jgi:hypothetical protein
MIGYFSYNCSLCPFKKTVYKAQDLTALYLTQGLKRPHNLRIQTSFVPQYYNLIAFQNEVPCHDYFNCEPCCGNDGDGTGNHKHTAGWPEDHYRLSGSAPHPGMV